MHKEYYCWSCSWNADVRAALLNTRKSQECTEYSNELRDLYWNSPLLFLYLLKLCIYFLYLLCLTCLTLVDFITLLVYGGYGYNV